MDILGYIGKQKLDRNGEIVLDLMEKHELILLNEPIECEGTYTWSNRNQNSAIDFVLINRELNQNYKELLIDDKKILDLSDHCLVEGVFKMYENAIKHKKNE